MTEKSAAKMKTVKKLDKDALKNLISKGKEHGYLSYDEINGALPDDMLSPDQIDETLIMFDDLNIEIVDEKKQKVADKIKKAEEGVIEDTAAVSDFGSVTDPVKMYLREMGLVSLLTREEEVEIAKRIEAGEQEVLKSLLDTTTGVESILNLGGHIEDGGLRPKHVLRDIDEGDTYVDEAVQIESFLNTIHAIENLYEEIREFRDKIFSSEELGQDEQRRLRRYIARRNNKIFELLKDWRFEAGVIDRIEKMIRSQIDWFDFMNKKTLMWADRMSASATEICSCLETESQFIQWVEPRCDLQKEEMISLFVAIKDIQKQIN